MWVPVVCSLLPILFVWKWRFVSQANFGRCSNSRSSQVFCIELTIFWVVHFFILIVVVFPPVPMSTLAHNGGYKRQLLWTTGIVVAMFFIGKMVYDINLGTVSLLLFLCQFFCSYIDLWDSTRTQNRCLNVHRQIEICSEGLCVQAGSTGSTEWLTHGRILFPKISSITKKAHLCTRCKSFCFVFLNIV